MECAADLRPFFQDALPANPPVAILWMLVANSTTVIEEGDPALDRGGHAHVPLSSAVQPDSLDVGVEQALQHLTEEMVPNTPARAIRRSRSTFCDNFLGEQSGLLALTTPTEVVE